MTTTTTATTGMTVEELVESLTGFDEIAIEKHFEGFDIYADGEAKGVRAMRALAFVWHRREGANDREALQTANNLSFKALSDYFLDAEEEVDPDQPDTPSGKDSEPPA